MATLGHNNKHVSKKLVFLLSCTGLLAAFVIADFFWWALEKSGNIVLPTPYAPREDEKEGPVGKKGHSSGRFLSATFADLPAPELEGEQMPSAPVPRLDGYAVQIKNLFYVFAGYGTIDHVHSHVDVYNFTSDKWVERFDIPEDMANSHLGVATDGRYIYIVSGQYGPQCRTAITNTFSLDTETKKWRSMPPLPAPRCVCAPVRVGYD